MFGRISHYKAIVRWEFGYSSVGSVQEFDSSAVSPVHSTGNNRLNEPEKKYEQVQIGIILHGNRVSLFRYAVYRLDLGRRCGGDTCVTLSVHLWGIAYDPKCYSAESVISVTAYLRTDNPMGDCCIEQGARMSEQTYSRLQSFLAAGGSWKLEPNLLYSMTGAARTGWWECSLSFKGIEINEAQGADPDAACFLAFDTLHQALPASVIKW